MSEEKKKKRSNTQLDLDIAMEKDPAARNRFEVYFTYAGFIALRKYRIAHWFYNHNMKGLAMFISASAKRRTGVDIHPAAKIAGGVFIDHA